MTTSTDFLSETPEARVDSRHRDRLVVGLLSSIEERGYAATTVADIVRSAKVSKRTFYEHFSSKEEVLRELYGYAAESLKSRHAVALAEPLPWRERIHASIQAFVTGLAEYPGLARTVLLELPAASPIIVTMREDLHDGFAKEFVAIADAVRADEPELSELSFDLAAAVVGAIYDLMIRSLERGAMDVGHVAEVGTELLVRVLTAPNPHPDIR